MIAKLRSASLLILVTACAAQAQETPVLIPFEGGSFTITETPDLDKILAFDGKELARNYVVFHDRMVDLRDMKVALFSVGDGGNQCGPATVIVWKSPGGDITTATVGEDCGAPPAAATEDGLYFVPYLIPGDSRPVQSWTPTGGLKVAGMLSFVPQAGTGWTDLDPGSLANIVDAFDNEAVYNAGDRLLGDDMSAFATGLLTGGGVETTASGIFWSSGCVPHACGGADSFMAIDPKGEDLYLAQQTEEPEPRTWPETADWPAEVTGLMRKALDRQQ